MRKHPATAREKPSGSSRHVEAKIKQGSLGNLSKIMPEDTKDVQANLKLHLHHHWLSWDVLGCAGALAALSVCPLKQSMTCQRFVLQSHLQAGKANGNMQMRSLHAKSCQLSAWLVAASCCQGPAPPGHSGATLWKGFAATFPFISVFLPATDLKPNAWKHCCESMERGMLFCHLFWLPFYFLPVTASAGS